MGTDTLTTPLPGAGRWRRRASTWMVVSGAVAVVAGALGWYVLSRTVPWAIDQRIWPLVMAGIAAGLSALLARGSERRFPYLVAIGLCGIFALYWDLLAWAGTLLDDGFSVDRMFARATLWTGVTLLLAGWTLAGPRERSSRWERVAAGESAPGLRTRLTRWFQDAGGWRVIVIGLGPVLLLTAVFGVLRVATDPVEHVLAEPLAGEAPTIPSSVAGDVAWTREFEKRVGDVASGARGPVVATGGTVMGLDPADGSTLWSYRRAGAGVIPLSSEYHDRVVVSPDRKYVGFLVSGPAYPGIQGKDMSLDALVLDADTGAIVLEKPLALESDGAPIGIQLSDHVALIGAHGYSLETGEEIWTLPTAIKKWDSLTAGHSTFVLVRECATDSLGLMGVCTLTLIDDDDISRERTLERVAILTWGRGFVLAQGWTLQWSDPVPDELRRVDGEFSLHDVGGELEAVNIETGESYPIGRWAGGNERQSAVVIPLYPAVDADHLDPDNPPKIAAVLDPVSRRIIHVAPQSLPDAPGRQDHGWATPDTSMARVRDDRTGTALEIGRPDGSGPITIPVEGPHFDTASVIAAPGTVVAEVTPTSGGKPYRTTLIGLS